ncbi:hypothetical protein [Flavobacterium sp.]|uniref:hypothetical protein n=1 Tax=Flavobacterium sp. TaxID=239 RepID=UPI003266011C
MLKKRMLFFIIFCVFTTAYSIDSITYETSKIINTWVWEKSIGGLNNPYIATPRTAGFKKKIVFTNQGKVITYKNDIEIRISTYEIKKGNCVSDNIENDLITFEGKTYIIEKLDNQNLILLSNNEEGSRTIYKK